MSISKLVTIARCPYYGASFGRYLINPNLTVTYLQTRKFANKLAETNQTSDVSTNVRPLGEKIKEGAKTATYSGIVIAGLSVTGIIFFYVFRELFSTSSPNTIYSDALNKCLEDSYIEQLLGAPIKGFGEESSRRRRNHVSHAFYERDGVKCIRMQFYIKGKFKRATVHLDKKEVNGKFEYRYLLVNVDSTNENIVLIDDRASTDKKLMALEPIL